MTKFSQFYLKIKTNTGSGKTRGLEVRIYQNIKLVVHHHENLFGY